VVCAETVDVKRIVLVLCEQRVAVDEGPGSFGFVIWWHNGTALQEIRLSVPSELEQMTWVVGLTSVCRLLRLVDASGDDDDAQVSRDLLWLAARMYLCHTVLSGTLSLYQATLDVQVILTALFEASEEFADEMGPSTSIFGVARVVLHEVPLMASRRRRD
jgi:hypothetical protein